MAKLLGYLFEVIYKPGLENKAADALSRKPAEILHFSISAPILVDLNTIKGEVEKDELLQKVLTDEKAGDSQQQAKFSQKNGLWHYKNRLVLSKSSTLIPAMLSTYYDSVVGGHSGFLRTYKRLASELYCSGMKADV